MRVTEALVDSVAAVVTGAGAGVVVVVVVVSDDAVLEMSPGSVGSLLVSPGSVGSGRTVCSPSAKNGN